MTETEILEKFPLQEPRRGQIETIKFILDSFDSGKRFVILEAPTGSGKSAIAITTSRFFDRSFYITSGKHLQDQLTKDFGENGRHLKLMVDLKGRNAYACDYQPSTLLHTPKAIKGWKDTAPHNCADGFCRRKDKTSFKECTDHGTCPYFVQVDQAAASRVCLMNFSSFLYQTQFTKRFTQRDLLIIDECLHPHTNVITDKGNIPIGKLVNQNIDCRVLSYNTNTKKLEYKPILRRLKRGKQQTYKVLAGNKVFYATKDHKIFTKSGMRRLGTLGIGDLVAINTPEISDIQRQVILGSLLGDASLQLVKSKRVSSKYINKGTRCRVKFKHGPKQFDYVDWKYDLLKDHVGTPPKTVPNGGFGTEIRTFSTKCVMYDVAKHVIVGDKKVPNQNWLNQIGPLGLAVWFMDDGSCTKDIMHFHTQGFTKSQNCMICDWLHKLEFKSAHVLPCKKNGHILYYIALNRIDTIKFAQLVSKYMPPFMRYKLPKGNCPDYTPIEPSIDQVSYHPIVSIVPYKTTFNYDLEIADNHNFFAGSTLVSNCHNIEQQLMGFVSLAIGDSDLVGKTVPEFEGPSEYAEWFRNNQIKEQLQQQYQVSVEAEDPQKADEIHEILRKLEFFLAEMDDGRCDKWVAEFTKSTKGDIGKVVFKPIYIDKYAHNHIFNMGANVLIMSATILDVNVMARSLGIKKEDIAAKRLKSDFPVEKRPIYYQPAAKITGGQAKIDTWGPALTKAINEIAKKYQFDKGIIHTHNFAIADMLVEKCSADVKRRFLYQKHFRNKFDLLAAHDVAPNSIIIAPAMHEGLDLADDLSRFQIICKIPFPNFHQDKQLAVRMESDPVFYDWITALKLVQSAGRSVRSKTDWADTYILDGSFEWWFRKNKRLLPSWFTEAIIDGP